MNYRNSEKKFLNYCKKWLSIIFKKNIYGDTTLNLIFKINFYEVRKTFSLIYNRKIKNILYFYKYILKLNKLNFYFFIEIQNNYFKLKKILISKYIGEVEFI